MLTEEIVVNLPADQVYHSLLNYVKDGSIHKRDLVKRFSEPSHIEVRYGGSKPLIDVIVKIDIVSQEQKSKVSIGFDFSKYITLLLLVNLFVLVFSLAMGSRYGVRVTDLDYTAIFFLFFYLFIAVIFPIAIIIDIKNAYKKKISAYLEGIEKE